jgi:TetR/AcrR family transcriptional regulator, regulator of mycofactocin system
VAGLRAKAYEITSVAATKVLPAASLVQRTRRKRSELIMNELEAVALAMFAERGFAAVTVEDIAAQAQISTRTFYRYFTVKEDIFQVHIRRRADSIRAALAARPGDEAPLHSVRIALQVVLSSEDPALLNLWMDVVGATPSVLRAVLGGCMLLVDDTIGEFLGARLGVPGDALVPTMLAGAVGGVLQAAQTRWRIRGGEDLATAVFEGLRVLDEGIGGHLGTLARSGTPGRNNTRTLRRPSRRK